MSISIIIRSDITDTIIGPDTLSDLTDYVNETNREIVDLAESLGVPEDDIDTNPIHNTIKRYAVAYLLKRYCQDKMGTNSVELPEQDRYFIKYSVYSKEVETLRTRITYEMLIGDVENIRDRAIVSGTIYRG